MAFPLFPLFPLSFPLSILLSFPPSLYFSPVHFAAMATLDAQVYPHILDGVLAAASRSTLLAFRGVSRALRIRSDELLAHRIVICAKMDDAPRHPAFMGMSLNLLLAVRRQASADVCECEQCELAQMEEESGVGPSRAKRRRHTTEPLFRTKRPHTAKRYAAAILADKARSSSSGHDTPTASTLTPVALGQKIKKAEYAVSLFQHTRVVDFAANVACHELWRASVASLSATFPRAQATRITVPKNPLLDAAVRMSPSAVWFRRLEPAPNHQAVHYRVDEVTTRRLVWSVMFHPFDSNLHHTAKGGVAWVDAFYASDFTREFVFLFVPDDSRAMRPREGRRVVRPRTPGATDWNDYRGTQGVLGVLEDVVFHMAPELERRVVFAGIEGLPPQALGLEAGTSQADMFDAVRDGIRRMLVGRRDNERDRVVHTDLWPDALVDECVAAVEIITLGEYRAKVGEEQFAWETRVELE